MNRPAIISPLYRLGYVPAEKRSVKPMPKWAKDLVPKPTGKNETVKSGQEDVETDTMPLIKSKVYRTLYHTEKLAARLKGSSLQATARNDWQFVFDYIRYVKDATGKEQVRSPRRTLHEGKGDCDCFTVFLSSLLINQGIPHFLRIMKQNGSDQWSHIYIVVPVDGKVSKKLTSRDQYIVMDCVTNKFDFEPPFTGKKDFPMALQYLDGIKSSNSGFGYGSLNGSSCEQKKPLINRMRHFVFTERILQQGLVPTEKFLNDNKIGYVPALNTETETGSFIVQTATGPKDVPTIISKEQAAALLQSMKSGIVQVTDTVQSAAAPATTQAETIANDLVAKASALKPNKDAFWWLLIGGGILYVATRKKKSAAAVAASTVGLGAIKKAAKKTLKTLSI